MLLQTAAFALQRTAIGMPEMELELELEGASGEEHTIGRKEHRSTKEFTSSFQAALPAHLAHEDVFHPFSARTHPVRYPREHLAPSLGGLVQFAVASCFK